MKIKVNFKKQKGSERRSHSSDLYSITGAFSQPAKFTSIVTKKEEKDDVDHFINFLRYVKGDGDTGSNVINFLLSSLKPKEPVK